MPLGEEETHVVVFGQGVATGQEHLAFALLHTTKKAC